MKRHPSLLSIAVILSAFAPTALTAAAIWGGKNWILMSGYAVSVAVPLMMAGLAIPMLIARIARHF
jgi:hypothetical protein